MRRGTGGQDPGRKGGSVWESGDGGWGVGFPRWGGGEEWEKVGKLCSIVQYPTIKKIAKRQVPKKGGNHD